MKWGSRYREKLKGINKNPIDFEDEELLQQEKWCALTEILDEYELIIEQLEKQIQLMKSCHTCIYNNTTNFHNYKFKCNYCANKCNWNNDFDSLEFLEAENNYKMEENK
jgi:hypothetical protein